MKAVVQRVSSGRVVVDGQEVGAIGKGLLALVGVHREDGPAQSLEMADRLRKLRIFSDPEGKMNRSLEDLIADGEDVGLLLVPNFTIYGDASKSRRPSFTTSAPYEEGRMRFEELVKSANLANVQTGVFGADMKVELVNDGPVTVILETKPANGASGGEPS